MITNFKIFEYHEDNMNRLLDKISKFGKNSLTSDELELLKNEGDIIQQKHFESGDIIFDVISTEDYGDEIRISGTITYYDRKYTGYFELSKENGNDPMSLLSNFIDFEPKEDDWYNLDDLIQELEYVYTEK